VEVDAHRPDDGALTVARRPHPVLLVLAALIALLPAALGIGVWLWQNDRHQAATEARDDDRAALNAATAETLAWATVDYRKVDDYFAAVEQGATGAFLDQFKQSEDALRKLLATNKSVQVPTIPKDGAALLERKDDQARVLIALDAVVTNTSSSKPQPRQYRLQLTLQRKGDDWLTDKLEFVG
jgi:hypothetical protein